MDDRPAGWTVQPRYRTLIEMLETRAREDADRTAFTFEGEPGPGRPTTYGELWRSIERFAALLLRRGLAPGHRAVLTVPNGGEFFAAFYGVQRAGGIAVPIFPGSGPERVASIADLCAARFVVVGPAYRPSAAAAGELERLADRRGLQVLRVAETAPPISRIDFPPLAPDDVAYIQYTSGSTGDPKGVELTHRNLLSNVEQMIAGFAITEREVFVSWLPVYHDMGLVLKTMVPFALGAELVLLPASLKNIRRWLVAIERHRGTLTAAPDFAYRLCLRYVRDPGRHDLSSLRLALNAAEPVRARTIADFEAAFALDNVMAVGYGLAEATVGVSRWPPGTPVKVDGRGFVSIGRPFPGVEIEIAGEAGEVAGSGEVGEILVKSPANTRGYHRNPGATARLLRVSPPAPQGALRRDGFLRTGDLGYRDADGDLFLVGRAKDIIIHAGRNVGPQEVEEIVDRTPGVRYTAAVGVDRGGSAGEQVYVFAEVRPTGDATGEGYRELAVEIVDRFHRQLGFRPGRVYLVKPHALPLTHNGKLQRGRLKERYLDGSLGREGWILFPDY